MNYELDHKFEDGEYLYRDELSTDSVPVWVPKTKFIRYIKSKYNILPKFYYDEVMKLRGINLFDKCKVCGKLTRFRNIFRGYRHTCSTFCRNRLISKGNKSLIIVTKKGLITHVVNQKSFTKYKVDKEVQDNIPNEINLIQLIQYLENNNSLWISGYNGKSIMYAPDNLKYLRLKSGI